MGEAGSDQTTSITSNIEGLWGEQQKLQKEIDAIQSQIDKARLVKLETGEAADPLWYRKASHSLKTKRRVLNSLNHKIAITKRRKKSDSEYDKKTMFVKVANDKLPKKKIEEIWNEVDLMVEKENRNES